MSYESKIFKKNIYIAIDCDTNKYPFAYESMLTSVCTNANKAIMIYFKNTKDFRILKCYSQTMYII